MTMVEGCGGHRAESAAPNIYNEALFGWRRQMSKTIYHYWSEVMSIIIELLPDWP
jgi:hypothetical protein